MKICLVKNCDKIANENGGCRGYCREHYRRLRRHGSLPILICCGRKPIPPFDRIMAKVIIDKKTSCWNFVGSLNRGGYGQVEVMGGKNVTVHRFMYEHFKDKVPEGLLVCHSCDNKKCCNPEHLWVGTCADNSKDMCRKGRSASGEKQGSCRLTVENVKLIRKIYTKYGKPTVHKNSWCTHQFLADEFGVALATICQVIGRMTWKI